MEHQSSAADVSSPVAAVARRYRWIDRLSRAGLLLALLLGVLAVAHRWSIWPAALLAAGALVLLGAPLLGTEGTARLQTTADLEAVRRELRGPTPPMLALQWSGAESIRASEDDGGVCEFSYLFGLRSTQMRIGVEERPADDADAAFDVTVAAGGQPWATYAVALRAEEGITTVDLSWTSDRRFPITRFLAWPLVHDAQRAAIEAQGYEVVERSVALRR